MIGLKQARERAGISQTELARRLNVSQSCISALEHHDGQLPQSVRMVREMEKILDVPRNYFFDKLG